MRKLRVYWAHKLISCLFREGFVRVFWLAMKNLLCFIAQLDATTSVTVPLESSRHMPRFLRGQIFEPKRSPVFTVFKIKFLPRDNS